MEPRGGGGPPPPPPPPRPVVRAALPTAPRAPDGAEAGPEPALLLVRQRRHPTPPLPHRGELQLAHPLPQGQGSARQSENCAQGERNGTGRRVGGNRGGG